MPTATMRRINRGYVGPGRPTRLHPFPPLHYDLFKPIEERGRTPMVQSAAADPDDAALSRAARAALGWGLVEASRRAGMSVAGVLAAEGRGIKPAPAVAPDRLRRAYEEAGVRFFDGPEGRGIRIPPR